MLSFLTRKYFNNRPSRYTIPDNYTLFLLPENMENITASLYSVHQKHGFGTPIEDFRNAVRDEMYRWAAKYKNKINNIDALGTNTRDYVLLLEYINRTFIKEAYDSVINSIPTRVGPHEANIAGKYHVGTVDPDPMFRRGTGMEWKTQKELMAEDYRTIDVWANTATDVSTAFRTPYRDNNRIGADQISRHKRNYDTNPDGLRFTRENASWENNHMRGYDIDYQIYKHTHTGDADRNTYIRYPDAAAKARRPYYA